MRKRTVIVCDKMQRGYRYELSAPAGRGFDPEFKPQLTPAEMLRLGVFGGKYMTDCRANFRRAGSPAPSCRRAAAIRRSISLASTPAGRYRNGGARAGSTRMTRAAGSNGIAATIWAAGCRTRTHGKSAAGRRFAATCGKFRRTASRAMFSAVRASARRCCTGPMTAGKFKAISLRRDGADARRRPGQRARTKSIATTTSPVASTCQPGRMPAEKSNATSSTRMGET